PCVVLHGRDGEQRLLVPTVRAGLFCLDRTLEKVLWRLPLPPSIHSAVAGDVDGDGCDEVVWALDIYQSVCWTAAHTVEALGILWLIDWNGRVRWRMFSDEIMDDSHIDNMLVLAPTPHRQGLIVFSDGPALDADGKVVFNLSEQFGHGQRVDRVRTCDGEERLVFADRGRLGNRVWKTGKLV